MDDVVQQGGSARLRLGGCRVDVTGPEQVQAAVRARLAADGPVAPLFLASANLDHLRHFGARSGRTLVFDDHEGADWQVLLDGMPLVWAARWLTEAPVPLLAGSDLLEPLLDLVQASGARLGLLGGSTEMHAAFRRRLEAERPDVRLVCALSPLRSELGTATGRAWLADEVREAGVDVLVVALGKPRQEEFLLEQGTRSGVKVGAAFGAAADFYAGTAVRARPSVRGTGLEWLYRLAQEPRRLSSRYLLQGPGDLRQLVLRSGAWVPELQRLFSAHAAGVQAPAAQAPAVQAPAAHAPSVHAPAAHVQGVPAPAAGPPAVPVGQVAVPVGQAGVEVEVEVEVAEAAPPGAPVRVAVPAQATEAVPARVLRTG